MRSWLTILAVVVTAPIPVVAPSAAEGGDPPRVKTESGLLEGKWVGESNKIAAFKGIPFAAPPIGEHRWKPPQAVDSRSGTLPAVEYGPVCPQPKGLIEWWIDWLTTTLGGDPSEIPALPAQDESCLYLNVWTQDPNGKAKRPVMVWLHGGSFWAWTASSDWTSGGYLAQKGVVVATVNYRLGALGFLAHPSLTKESPHGSSGNYGLLDQISALRWIQRNIAAFGGDPANVTIFGESSGASAVVYLMTSPLAKGLFHRAIGQSFMEPYVVADKPETAAFSGRLALSGAEQLGTELARRLGLEGTNESLERLRGLEAENIVEASVIQQGTNFFVPNVDGWVLPRAPAEVYRKGRQHDVPFMIGVTANEGSTLLFDPEWSSVTDYQDFVRAEFGSKAEKLLSMYSPTGLSETRPARLRWYQDGCLTAARYLAGTMRDLESPTFLYVFSRVPPGRGGELLGAYHSSEVPFIFNTHMPGVWPTREGDEALTESMGRYWVQFAETGDPNAAGLPVWHPYERIRDNYMNLDHESAERTFDAKTIEAMNTLEALFWR